MARAAADRTGRPSEWFQSTHWTLIQAARTLDAERRRAVLDIILARYWKPVWAYLRWNKSHRPRDADEADDLTQGFFHEIVLGKGLIDLADSAKGRFRTFLLTALDRYVSNVHRYRSARVRSPEGRLLPLEWEGSARAFEPADESTPQRAFLRAWAVTLLADVLGELESECLRGGQRLHWDVFHAQVFGPIMNGTPLPPIDQTCRQLGIEKPKTAHNMVITVKRRFRRILEERVRLMVDRDEDVEDEIRDLIGALGRGGADG